MALNGIIEAPHERPNRGSYWGSFPGSEQVCSVETEGIYWFLYALFETLEEHKGKELDRHGWCSFVGAELPALANTLVAARTAIAAQPNEWTVVTDVSGALNEEHIVQNQDIQAVLTQILQAIPRTEARDTYLSFVNN